MTKAKTMSKKDKEVVKEVVNLVMEAYITAFVWETARPIIKKALKDISERNSVPNIRKAKLSDMPKSIRDKYT